uniref:Uncharacterized protein n=1 Tax=Cannabis sativa TaxID=3483 RepID=A0A803QSK9_CANSA
FTGSLEPFPLRPQSSHFECFFTTTKAADGSAPDSALLFLASRPALLLIEETRAPTVD